MANYLYNGVGLQALPERDKETYPYAVILNVQGLFAGFWLYFCKQPVCHSDGHIKICGPHKVYRTHYAWEPWDLAGESDVVNDSVKHSDSNAYALWTSHDILNEDGSVYLAASDPVPVNPADPIDPASLLMGWLVGRRIAGQRSKA